jgi:hypothetical protein
VECSRSIRGVQLRRLMTSVVPEVLLSAQPVGWGVAVLIAAPAVFYLILLPFVLRGGAVGERAQELIRQLLDLLRDIGRRR